MRVRGTGSTAERRGRGRRGGATALALAATLGAGMTFGGVAAAVPGTTTVSNDQIGNACDAPAAYCTYRRAGGTAAVVDDARANAGSGYLRLDTPGTPNASDKAYVFAREFSGRKLSEITTIEYETFIERVGTSNTQQAPAINIPVNPNKPGAPSFTTLVFEPLYTGTVVPGRWQTWSPSSTPSGSGGWWASGTVTAPGTPNAYGFATYTASFADVKAALPDAVVAEGVGPNQGGGNDGLRSGVDLLKINDSTIDFDNAVTPTALAPAGGDRQTAEVGKPFGQPLAATLTGAGDTPVPDKDVVFTVTKGAASFAGSPTAPARTDARGVATSPVLTAGTTPGPVEVTATSGTLSATFTETVAAREADLSVLLNIPPTVRAGATNVPVTVTVRNNGAASAAPGVATGLQLPNGFRITAAPRGAVARDGRSVGYLENSIAPGASVTYSVTATVDRSVRGVQTAQAGTASIRIKDPNIRNNAAQARTNVVK